MAVRCRFPGVVPGNATMHTTRGGKSALKIMSASLIQIVKAGSWLALVIFYLAGCGSGNKEETGNKGMDTGMSHIGFRCVVRDGD